MSEIQTLGTQQIWLYYEVIEKRINESKIQIIEDISNVLGQEHHIDNETFVDKKKFNRYYLVHESIIQDTTKEMFLILRQQESDIQKEIGKRQTEMLREIGIIAPSIRVGMITESTKWKYFPLFEKMIKYIKNIQQGKTKWQPNDKKIQYPPQLQEKLIRFKTTGIEILMYNSGILQN